MLVAMMKRQSADQWAGEVDCCGRGNQRETGEGGSGPGPPGRDGKGGAGKFGGGEFVKIRGLNANMQWSPLYYLP